MQEVCEFFAVLDAEFNMNIAGDLHAPRGRLGRQERGGAQGRRN